MIKIKKETDNENLAALSLEAQGRDVAKEIHRLTESLLPDDDRSVRLARLLADLRGGGRVTDFRLTRSSPMPYVNFQKLTGPPFA